MLELQSISYTVHEGDEKLEILKDIMTTKELSMESTIQCVLASLRLMQVGRLCYEL